jgi:hypothetical protein
MARLRRRFVPVAIALPTLAWAISIACGDGGGSSGETVTDAALDARRDTSRDYGDVTNDFDSGVRDAARVSDDAAAPPPYCAAPVACADGGTEITELARFVDQVQGVAADGCDVYWGDQAGNIRSVPRCGGPVRTIATGQPYPVIGLTLDPWSVYWAAGGVIRRASKGGGSFYTIASDPTTSTSQPWAIAVDSEFVYWTNNYGAASRMWRQPLAGGSPVELALLGFGGTQPYGMAIDQDRVFFATNQIQSALKDGGGAIDLGGVGDVLDAWCIAVDDTDVYYTRYETGNVTRVPKAETPRSSRPRRRRAASRSITGRSTGSTMVPVSRVLRLTVETSRKSSTRVGPDTASSRWTIRSFTGVSAPA